MQDLTGVPSVVDLAAMREAVTELGGDPDHLGRATENILHQLVHEVEVLWSITYNEGRGARDVLGRGSGREVDAGFLEDLQEGPTWRKRAITETAVITGKRIYFSSAVTVATTRSNVIEESGRHFPLAGEDVLALRRANGKKGHRVIFNLETETRLVTD